jgi:alanyl-tRNA synthetase
MKKEWTLNEIRELYQSFFEDKKHVCIPSAPLVPENDPTTLFTGSGMQPLLPYLLGKSHPQGPRIVNSQKCFRAVDIEEVGDNRHTTFFEMLGNWSFGNYFKEQQLLWFFEFLTDVVKLAPEKLYVSVFGGDDSVNIPRDTESAKIWEGLFNEKKVPSKVIDLGTPAQGSAQGMQEGRIFYYDSSKNWWSRSGTPETMPPGEPGGPDSEVFYDFGESLHSSQFGKYCHPNCDCGRFMEIGNSVFMEYLKQADGSFTPLPRKNVDFGGGLERITAAANNTPDVFRVDALRVILDKFEKTYDLKYQTADEASKKSLRIIADHVRAAVFMIGDGIIPSNKDRGYLLRRLIRRAAYHSYSLVPGGISNVSPLVNNVIDYYKGTYPELEDKHQDIEDTFDIEEEKFVKALGRANKEFGNIDTDIISGTHGSKLASTFGLPIEATKELVKKSGKQLSENFNQEFADDQQRHKKVSRKGLDKKFKGGLADHSEMSIKYHTATHLLHQALRTILGNHVLQRGSNITPERLRFDFSHPEKMTAEQIKGVEELVNQKIKEGLHVTRSEMTVEEAKQKGALGLFEHKYGEKVSVYAVGGFSLEICGGPHVYNTGVLGRFRILKEESAGAGIRRIKAILE